MNVEVVVTIARLHDEPDLTAPYLLTEIYRLEFEDEVKAKAWLNTGVGDYAVAIEKMGGQEYGD